MPRSFCVSVALTLAVSAPLAAQAPAQYGPPATICGQQVAPPRAQPPDNSAPVVYLIGLCFDKQGGTSIIEPETYLYYIQLRPSLPSQNMWVPWDDAHYVDRIRRLLGSS